MAKKIIVYGNAQCADCVALKEAFEAAGIRFGFVDVLGGLAHLKKFIRLREGHAALFARHVAEGRIGIPAVVVDDGEVFVEPKGEELAALAEKLK